MEELVEKLADGNVTEVKVVLASIIVVLAVYQLALMAVGWGKVKVPFLHPKPASFVHRAVGDAIVVITVVVAWMCIGYFEYSDGVEHALPGEKMRVTLHVIAGTLLLVFVALKIAVVRWWHSAGRFLPPLGLTVFSLYVATWLTSAADYLMEG